MSVKIKIGSRSWSVLTKLLNVALQTLRPLFFILVFKIQFEILQFSINVIFQSLIFQILISFWASCTPIVVAWDKHLNMMYSWILFISFKTYYFVYPLRTRWKKCSSTICPGSRFSSWRRPSIFSASAEEPWCSHTSLPTISRKTIRAKSSK